MTGDSRRGRRDNGLDAAAFVPLLDVDPRVGEHLLDVLASAGVPAYLEPSADVEPYTRALSLPSPPTDRLWVDRDQRRQARIIVDAETPLGPRPVPPPRDDEPSHGLATPRRSGPGRRSSRVSTRPRSTRTGRPTGPTSATATGCPARNPGRTRRTRPRAPTGSATRRSGGPVRSATTSSSTRGATWRPAAGVAAGPAAGAARPTPTGCRPAKTWTRRPTPGPGTRPRRPGRTPRTSGSTGRRPWTAATTSTSSRHRRRRSRAPPATRCWPSCWW